ncbi:MAG: lysoplasmalogenase family protein [Candidatus Nanopelagicales bacterium]
MAALLFMASDTLLAWARFVGSAPGGRVAVMITYQLAQAGFVLAIPTLVI